MGPTLAGDAGDESLPMARYRDKLSSLTNTVRIMSGMDFWQAGLAGPSHPQEVLLGSVAGPAARGAGEQEPVLLCQAAAASLPTEEWDVRHAGPPQGLSRGQGSWTGLHHL